MLEDQGKTPLAVRYVDDRTIELGARSSNVAALPLTPEWAATVGRALLAASAVCQGGPRKPDEGEAILDCHFPVLGWGIARSAMEGGGPILRLRIIGGMDLHFQLPALAAAECGAQLAAGGERQLALRPRRR